jgi:hypothetical protein
MTNLTFVDEPGLPTSSIATSAHNIYHITFKSNTTYVLSIWDKTDKLVYSTLMPSYSQAVAVANAIDDPGCPLDSISKVETAIIAAGYV